jgi:2-hydroxycyclohexanecarboxyl-CoA dehydrogenase
MIGETLDRRLRLDGQVALVTGGATSIGATICRTLAALGAHVYITDILGEEAEALAAELLEAGLQATGFALDVTDPAAVAAAVDRATGERASIEILVCNAGFTETHPLTTEGPDYWDRITRINYLGVVYSCAAVLKAMQDSGYGRIVTITSEAGRIGMPREAVYAGTKGGVLAFTKSVAREAARNGVTVNAVSPGLIESPAIEQYDPRGLEALTRGVPVRRIGTQQEVADAVAFVASRPASYITGEVLSVGGGIAMAG